MPPFWTFTPAGREGGYVPPSKGRGMGGCYYREGYNKNPLIKDRG